MANPALDHMGTSTYPDGTRKGPEIVDWEIRLQKASGLAGPNRKAYERAYAESLEPNTELGMSKKGLQALDETVSTPSTSFDAVR
jgi:hypothetical protein